MTNKINENSIREAAYFMWENSGRPAGQDEYYWSLASEQLNKKCSASCNASATKKSSSSTASAAKKSPVSSSTTAKKSSKK